LEASKKTYVKMFQMVKIPEEIIPAILSKNIEDFKV